MPELSMAHEVRALAEHLTLDKLRKPEMRIGSLRMWLELWTEVLKGERCWKGRVV